LLVGGFGENVYLKQELDRSFGHLETQLPTKAWAAICRGAILKGLGNDLVVNHISKFNYGCVHGQEFIENFHLPVDRKYHKVRCVWIADNQMRWFLHRVSIPNKNIRNLSNKAKQGENVEKDEPVQHTFYFPVTSPKDLQNLTANIYYSGSMNAESRVERGK
jgi:hypothetical protein